MAYLNLYTPAALKQFKSFIVAEWEWLIEDREELCRPYGMSYQIPRWILHDGNSFCFYLPNMYGLSSWIPAGIPSCKTVQELEWHLSRKGRICREFGSYLTTLADAYFARTGMALAMASVTSVDNLVNQLITTPAGIWTGFKTSITTEGAGIPHSMYNAAGFPGAGGSTGPNAAAGAVLTRTDNGVIPLPAWPTPPLDRFLTGFWAGGATNGAFILVDELVHTDALSGTVTTAQTVNSTALTRYTSGVGVQPFTYCWTATGGTGTTYDAISVDTVETPAGENFMAGVNFWTGAWGGGTVAPTSMQMQGWLWPAGRTGMTQVNNIDLNATTGTAGDFGVMLTSPFLAICPYAANSYTIMNQFLDTGLIKLEVSAALQLIAVPSTTSTGNMQFGLRYCDET